DPLIGNPQEHLVEHLVVRQQNIGRIRLDGLTVCDEPFGSDSGTLSVSSIAGVDGSTDSAELWVLGDHPGQALGLVGGKGVHRVEDEPADSGAALPPVADDMVEDRVEE